MRLTVGKQILVACIIIVLAFTGLNIYTFYHIKAIEAGYEGLINRSAPLVFEVKDVNAELQTQAAAVRAYVITGNDGYMAQYNASRERMDKLLTSLEKKLITPEGRQKMSDLKAALHDYHKVPDAAIQARRTEGMAAAIEYLKDGSAKIINAELQIADFVQFLSERMELRKQQNQEVVSHLERTIVILDVAIFVLAFGAVLWLARRISRPLVAVANGAKQIAGGDLQKCEIAYYGQDEIGELVQAFVTMSTNLRQLVGQVARASEQVAAASEELTASAEQSAQAAGQVAETVSDVAAGALRQTEAVNQAVAVVDQMAAAIGHIAANATEVSAKSEETAKAAATGSEAMTEATAQMEVISQAVSQSAQVVQKLGASSKQIGEIVNVISGIASQTNLLALNAAIEAARAGEQGRGFAVVAEEVRKLAEQSQEAAQKIAGIIKEIQAETDTAVQVMGQGTAEVAKGSQLLTATGERFRTIVTLVQSLNQQIQEISAAAEELSASSSEVVSAVGGIKQVADETAAHTQTISTAAEEQSASMQEVASSSQALARMAEELHAAIRNFKL
ncbi:methyl-accepting chemotaxis sensory transducer [Thermosinus carboxydivorans Nor1]|uniref:Methyl-accepting chemotaxis sensory transducer n=1 Tax=Thermosinus carboxydivorans Nor1 TaxID=401526 RepID=A1HU10_9FIRM|nr:methyl-accepting chemotaxis protein [Thermosinus carboxydivorans]EAX46484.1 methyl-accepting chemotaxis sensory transducer [Thermosinus carboxydivorans Nor1]